MATLKITGMQADGTFAGAQGGTEMMLAGLKQRVDPSLLQKVNIICSRVREVPVDRPSILWLHDTWNDPESAHLQDPASRRRFAKLVFVSHHQQHTFHMGLGVPYADGVVLQNAIEPIPAHQKPSGEEIRLIYHTTPHRGLEILVPVFVQLAERYPELRLEVYSSFQAYGWIERDAPYEFLFDICRNHPQISYFGYQPNEVVRAALQRAHIFAYPNIWPETSCIAAIEALSAGCEVVCPNYCALPETTANFATMYHYTEHLQQHAELFRDVLEFVVAGHRKMRTNRAAQAVYQEKLAFQKQYVDQVYGWSRRAKQWTGLLEAISEKIDGVVNTA